MGMVTRPVRHVEFDAFDSVLGLGLYDYDHDSDLPVHCSRARSQDSGLRSGLDSGLLSQDSGVVYMLGYGLYDSTPCLSPWYLVDHDS